jgi:hypothetical protein
VRIPPPFYQLLNEINLASSRGLPLIAIAGAVALPDICVSLVSDDGRSTPDGYRAWCEENLSGDPFSFITADDLYSMRCGILHNGRLAGLKHNVSRLIFTFPESGLAVINGKLNGAYYYSVTNFCYNITASAADWFERNKESQNLQKNLDNLMQFRMNLPGHVVGIPIIA